MLLSLAIMTAFIPGVIGSASNTSWAVMWLAMPLLLLNCKIEMTLIHVLGLLFLSYAALSLLWSPHGFLELMQLLALASVFVWGCTLKDLRSVTIGLSIGLAVSSVIAIPQYFQVELPILNAGKGASGLFINPNIYAEISGLILILLIINKLWWFIPVTVPGLLVSSRAVMIGFVVIGLMWLWNKSKLAVVSIIGSLIFAASFINIATGSIYERLNMWNDMSAGFNVFGNGIGSFVFKFPDFNKHLDATTSFAEYAHNDLLQLIFELGIGSLPLILIVALLLKVNNEYRNALVFFIVIGLFGFPLHMPDTGFVVALVAAQLAKSRLGYRFAFNSRRSVLFNRMETA